MTTRPLTALSVAVLGFQLALAGPSSAGAQDRQPIADSYTDTASNWCGVQGLTAQVSGTADGWFQLHQRQPGTEPYFTQHVRIDETHTANGVTTRYTENTIDKDLKIQRVGNTFVITTLSTGNATLYGSDGKTIARNPGQVRFRLVIDAKTGTELSFELIKGSTGRTDDFCAAEVPLLD